MTALQAGLSLFLLGWVSGHGRWEIAMLVCLCALLRIRRWAGISLVTVVYLLVWPPFSGVLPNHWPGLPLILQARYGENLLGLTEVKYFALLLRLLLAYVFWRLTFGWARGQRLLGLHGGLLLLILSSDGIGQLGPLPGTVAASALVSFSFYFYYVCYLALERPSGGVGQFLTFYLAPFWECSTSPRPVLDLERAQHHQSQLWKRSSHVALRSCGIVLVGGLVNASLYGLDWHGQALPWRSLYSPLPDIANLGPAPALFGVYSRWQLGLSILWTGLHRITNYFALFSFLECCHLMLGYDVPSRFEWPGRARSFGDFYNCLMPYYVMLVNRLYLYPLFAWLRNRRLPRKLAYDMALLGGLLAAGFVTHLLRDMHLVVLLGARKFLWLSLQTDLPYLSLLFLAIRFVRLPARWQAERAWPLRFLVFLSVYSTVIFFRVGGLFVSHGDRLRFLAHLLMFWEAP